MRTGLIGTALSLLLWGQLAFADGVLVVGDSISAAFGLDTRDGWVALLEQRLNDEGFDQSVVNASISGDTSAGGLSRLPALLKEHQPEWVIIELGGNDGLRGQPLSQLQQNLAAMVRQSQEAGAKVLLLGMMLPPNYGRKYTQAFSEVFTQVAQEYQVALVPFLLEGVGGQAELMQQDGIHPTATAQPLLLENVWKTMRPLL